MEFNGLKPKMSSLKAARESRPPDTFNSFVKSEKGLKSPPSGARFIDNGTMEKDGG
jgi:hypothetical protein